MSSQGSPTLDLDVRSRRTERRVAIAAAAMATMSPWLLERIDPTILAAASIAAGLAVALGFWRSGWIGTRYRLTRITWMADGRWLLAAHGGNPVEAVLSSASRRGTGLAWLRWQAPHGHSILLTRGDLAAGELRRLVVRLGIDRLQAPAGIDFAAMDTPPGALKTWIRRSFLPVPVARTRR